MSPSSLTGNAFSRLIQKRPLVCSRSGCDKTFARKKHQLDHEKAVHDETAEYVCEIGACEEKYRYPGDLVRHQQQKHQQDPKTHICDICSRSYTRASTLKAHKNKKHGGRRTGLTQRSSSPHDEPTESDQDVLRDIHADNTAGAFQMSRSIPPSNLRREEQDQQSVRISQTDGRDESDDGRLDEIEIQLGQTDSTELRRELRSERKKTFELTETVKALKAQIETLQREAGLYMHHNGASADTHRHASDPNSGWRHGSAVPSSAPQYSDLGSSAGFDWENSAGQYEWDKQRDMVLPPVPSYVSIDVWELSDPFQDAQPGALQGQVVDASTNRVARLREGVNQQLETIG